MNFGNTLQQAKQDTIIDFHESCNFKKKKPITKKAKLRNRKFKKK